LTLAAFFFDVLHLDGTDLLDRPLSERAAILAELVGDWRVPAIETDDPELAEAFLADALATGHEGVMVKALDSPYEPGAAARRGARSSRCARSTSWCSRPSGDTAGAAVGSRTSTSVRAIPRRTVS